MEVSVEVHKIIKCTKSSTIFIFYYMWGCWCQVGKVAVIRTNYQGCRFDVHFIHCQTSTDISEIVNDFVQYVQNYFQYVYISL